MVNTPVLRPALAEKIAQEKLSGLTFWEDMDAATRAELLNSAYDVTSELANQVKSIFRTGKLLDVIHNITQPFGGFRHTIAALWGEVLPVNTAYRWMAIYRKVNEQVSDLVVDCAVANGLQLISGNEKQPFGRYTSIIKRLPPPTDGGVRAVKQWVDEVKVIRDRQRKSRGPQALDLETDRAELTKETYLYIRARQIRLTGKEKAKYLEDLASYCLRMAGVGGPKMLTPSAPPEEWEAIRRGRPTMSEEEKAERKRRLRKAA